MIKIIKFNLFLEFIVFLGKFDQMKKLRKNIKTQQINAIFGLFCLSA
jgi:hypothetical protein